MTGPTPGDEGFQFPILKLPRELRDAIYRSAIADETTQLEIAVMHNRMSGLPVKKLRVTQALKIIYTTIGERDGDDDKEGHSSVQVCLPALDFLRLNRQTRQEALKVAHLPTVSDLRPQVKDERSYGRKMIYHLPGYADLGRDDLITQAAHQYYRVPNPNQPWDDFQARLDRKDYETEVRPWELESGAAISRLEKARYLKLITHLTIGGDMFPAVSPWSKMSMLQLASLPHELPNLETLSVETSFEGILNYFDAPGTRKVRSRSSCPLANFSFRAADLERVPLHRILSIPAMDELTLIRGLRFIYCSAAEMGLLPFQTCKSDPPTPGCVCTEDDFKSVLKMRCTELTDYFSALHRRTNPTGE